MEGRGFVPAHVVLREVLGDAGRQKNLPTRCERQARERETAVRATRGNKRENKSTVDDDAGGTGR